MYWAVDGGPISSAVNGLAEGITSGESFVVFEPQPLEAVIEATVEIVALAMRVSDASARAKLVVTRRRRRWRSYAIPRRGMERSTTSFQRQTKGSPPGEHWTTSTETLRARLMRLRVSGRRSSASAIPTSRTEERSTSKQWISGSALAKGKCPSFLATRTSHLRLTMTCHGTNGTRTEQPN